MINCKICKNKKNCVYAGEDREIDECIDYSPMTNEDWIRTMPIEQLAKRIGCMVEMDSCDPYETCDECRLAWLKREVKL